MKMLSVNLVAQFRTRVLILFFMTTLVKGDLQSHPCERPCEVNTPSMVCKYHFNVEKYYVRSKACYYCPFIFEDCFRADCIAADGVRRLVTVINRQLPGPAINICDGDKVEIVVQNSLPEECTSIHWHGINQHCSPYMDGVALITQCPILPGLSFTYYFEPDPPGCHMYHAHIGTQRGDGVFGPFVVRKPKEFEYYRDLYNFDLKEHVITIFDWLHEPVQARYISDHQGKAINAPDTILINGKGRYKEFEGENDGKFYTPLEVFTVTQGNSYRFRIINAGVEYCPIEMVIYDHKMKVICTDGFDIELVEADSLVTTSGERWEFILDANQEIGNYWMVFKGLQNCSEEFYGAFNVAILHYEGANDDLPQPDITYDTIVSTGVQVNPVNEPSSEITSLTISELRNIVKDHNPALQDDVIQLTFAFDFYPIDNPVYHKTGLYGFLQVSEIYQVRTMQMNHISMRMPSFPPLSQPEDIKPDTFCNEATIQKNCEEEFCACVHAVKLPLFRAVEILFVDEGKSYDSNHPFHLHGYTFLVVAMEKIGENTTVARVKQMLADKEVKVNLYDPIYKDTVSVPRGGFTMIRLYLDNPGFWLLHCHLEFHAENGMGVVLQVGEYSDFPPVPPNFPRCGDYLG